MLILVAPLLLLPFLTARQVPRGAELHVRLTDAVGSYASKVGAPLVASLIAPVDLDGNTLLPAGTVLAGTVTFVSRVGLGIRHETAALGMNFTEIRLPDGETQPLFAQVTEVDNGRERVVKDGRIRGPRSTSSLCYRTSGYLRSVLLHSLLLFSVHAEIAVWAIKTLVVQVPEPEIYYPAGAELTLSLTAPLDILSIPDTSRAIEGLSAEERADVAGLIAAMPYRAYAAVSHRPSDLVNAVFIGSRNQVAAAFAAAGWMEAQPSSLHANILGVRAVSESQGFLSAPMSSLLVNNTGADMSWEKGLNDMSKRHHIRVWRQGETFEGAEIWIGAATRDIDYAYLRPGHTVTHRVEENIDQERDKVAYDLEFTTCVQQADWLERPDVPRASRNATGDFISTDGRVAVLRLNRCETPRLSTETLDTSPLAMRGGGMYRFARREILSMRSDLLRHNIYWRSFEGIRLLVIALRRRHQQILEAQALGKPPANMVCSSSDWHATNCAAKPGIRDSILSAALSTN